MNPSFEDVAGQKGYVGDLVVYAVKIPASPWPKPSLRYGKVFRVAQRNAKGRVYLHVSDLDTIHKIGRRLVSTAKLLVVNRKQVPQSILSSLDRLEPVYRPNCTCESWYTAHAKECPQYEAG